MSVWSRQVPMDRAAFISAIIAELALQKQQEASSALAVSGSAERAYKALCFDMPVVDALDCARLVDLICELSSPASSLSSAIADAAGSAWPSWLELSPPFLAGVLYLADRASHDAATHGSESIPISKLAAVVFLKLAAVRLAAAASPALSASGATIGVTAAVSAAVAANALIGVRLSHDMLIGVSCDDWTALNFTEDCSVLIQSLSSVPSELSTQWSQYLFILRDRAVTFPPLASAIIDTLMPMLRRCDSSSSSDLDAFITRAVLSVVCDILESPRVAALPLFQSTFTRCLITALVCAAIHSLYSVMWMCCLML